MNKNKFDHLIIGLVLGLLAPTLGIMIFFYSKFSESNLAEFLTVSIQEKMLSPLLSLCAVINLGVFYLFIQFDKLQTAKGIILATFIYGLAIVLLKFGIVRL
ncbi:MAG: hypothetical protein ACOYMA_13525 [Bacteroidia bacterium]